MSDPLPPVASRRRLSRRLEVSRDLPADLVEQLWQDDADRLLCDCQILQTKPLCTVGRLDREENAYTLKRHTWGRISRAARMLHRESVASKCWRVGRRLAAAGIATPLPRARLEYGLGPLTHRSYLLTDYIPGTNLYRALRRREVDAAALIVVAEQVVQLWQRLAVLECTHNDLKPENFIIDDQLRVWLIDLEKVRFCSSPRRLSRRQQADLERLFHPRVWYDCLQEARIFWDHFCDAGWGQMLDRFPALQESRSAGRLTVYVRGAREESPTDASLEDIAHEVTPVDAQFVPGEGAPPTAEGIVHMPTVAKSTPRLHSPATRRTSSTTTASSPDLTIAGQSDNEWVLLVEAGDRVTPDLAWEIQQRIAEPESHDAYRIPREALLGSDPLTPDLGESECDLRLFRRTTLQDLSRAEKSETTLTFGRLENRIEYVRFPSLSAFIGHLDECATWSAEGRYRRGEEARLLRTFLALPVDFLRHYIACRYYDLGWSGLQLSVVETAFIWIEEAKLWRQSRQFAQLQTVSVAPAASQTDDEGGQQTIAIRSEQPVRRAA